jgi:hypothetical protein
MPRICRKGRALQGEFQRAASTCGVGPRRTGCSKAGRLFGLKTAATYSAVAACRQPRSFPSLLAIDLGFKLGAGVRVRHHELLMVKRGVAAEHQASSIPPFEFHQVLLVFFFQTL